MPQVNDALKLVAQKVTAGRPAEAVRLCREMLLHHPTDPRIHYALAIALDLAGNPDESIAEFRRAIALKPDFFEALTNLGTVLSARRRFSEALESYSEAARLQPRIAEMHVNLGNSLRDNWMLDQSIVSAEKAISLKPSLPEAHLTLGGSAACLGQFDRAKDAYRRAIALRPEYPAAHLNLALIELVTGNLRQGFAEYEWRRRCPDAVPPRNFPQPAWTGQPLDGKTILLFPEQGFGDAIHFVRYVPMVAARGAKVILESPPALATLFRKVPGIDRLIIAGEPLPPFDLQCALPSLPAAFQTDLETIPAPIPYLSADPDAIQRWRNRLAPSGTIREIGIAWSGSPTNRNDHNRSIPLQDFAPILSIDRTRFHSLQISPPPPGFPISDWSAHLNDFAETAALIANLDLIISVDTAVAHLAGAMGKPVCLLIPFPPDWRWQLDRPDTPWYPTIRLFRQPQPNAWTPAIRALASHLEKRG